MSASAVSTKWALWQIFQQFAIVFFIFMCISCIVIPYYLLLVPTIVKYQELANEICAMLKQNAAQVIPIVISST